MLAAVHVSSIMHCVCSTIKVISAAKYCSGYAVARTNPACHTQMIKDFSALGIEFLMAAPTSKLEATLWLQ